MKRHISMIVLAGLAATANAGNVWADASTPPAGMARPPGAALAPQPGLACLAKAAKARLTVDIVETTCYRTTRGDVTLDWDGARADVLVNLGQLKGKQGGATVSSTAARAFAKSLVAATHMKDSDGCVSSAQATVSLRWSCEGGPTEVVRFLDDFCGSIEGASLGGHAGKILRLTLGFVERSAVGRTVADPAP